MTNRQAAALVGGSILPLPSGDSLVDAAGNPISGGVLTSAGLQSILDRLFYLMFRDDAGYNPVPSGAFNSFTTENAGLNTGAGSGYGYNAAGDYYSNSTNFPRKTWGVTLNENQDASIGGYSIRHVIPAGEITVDGTAVRLRMTASDSYRLDVTGVGIVEQDSGADGTETPTEITFNGGSSGFSISAGESITSDFVKFAIDETKTYLVIVDYENTGMENRPRRLSGYTTYYKAGATSYDQQTVSGYSAGGHLQGVDRLEIQAASGAVIDSNANYTAEDQKIHGTYGQIGQVVTLATDEYIKTVRFRIKRLGSPTGSAYVKLFATSGTPGSDGVPSGAAVATSDAVDVSGVSDSEFTYYSFSFTTAVEMPAGGMGIALEYTGGDSDNCLLMQYAISSNHAGNYIWNNAGTWTANASADTSGWELLRDGTVSDIILETSTVTAEAEPDTARVSVFVTPVDSITINTDLKAYATRDGGSTWDEITLELINIIDGVYQYSGTVTLTSTGTSMAAKLATDNSKIVQFNALGFSYGEAA